jgi:hypothetical protein
VLGLPPHTVKLGIMDEERRTSVNLKECIRARNRVAFINTGFLDRTGDEIHTSMEAGPFSRKDFIKRKGWITAYENRNVDIGLECGLSGRAQIGKGMWAMPDLMAAMLDRRSPTPRGRQHRLGAQPHGGHAACAALSQGRRDRGAGAAGKGGRRAHVDGILDIPLASFRKWTEAQVMREVENNAPRDPWLCRALDRSGGGLFQGARHERCRPDGGPRDLPDLGPAHRQLAASWHRQPPQVMEAMKKMAAGGGPPERGRPRPIGRWPPPSRGRRFRRPAIWSSRGGSSLRAIPNPCCMPGARCRDHRQPECSRRFLSRVHATGLMNSAAVAEVAGCMPLVIPADPRLGVGGRIAGHLRRVLADRRAAQCPPQRIRRRRNPRAWRL